MRVALFDTNILIDHLKGKHEATLTLTQCIKSGIQPACSVISEIELFCGIRPEEESQFELFISGFEMVEVNTEIAKIAGMYMNRYRKGNGINMADAIIAASAIYLEAKLYTLNTKHYPMKDIKAIRPY
ncbi:MAG: PIN domain-containing protein [Clostridia bacterium]|nr:PIN domain-containing protein [Clostridia bacterium]